MKTFSYLKSTLKKDSYRRVFTSVEAFSAFFSRLSLPSLTWCLKTMGSASEERDSKKGISLTLRIGVYLGFGFLFWMVIGNPFPHYPTVAERRKDFGNSFIYQGAPFCCIYVGLDNKEAALFSTNFWRFAEQHKIRRPKKHYSAYSGPRLATCKNDHVSVFVDTIPTTNLISRSQRSAGLTSKLVSWQGGIWTDRYWPTNACRITKNGQEIIAPLSGVVKLAPNDTNYPLRDFILLSDELTGTLQSAFPDRAVRIFSYHGDKQSN